MSIQILIIILVLLFLAVAIFGAFFVYVYWWLIQRAAPQLDGDLELAGLDEAVEVLRDKHGVPHIYAQNRADLFRAQGFVHAQDRLWQMEQNRRIAAGRLSELFGDAALEVDRFSRIIGFWRAAQAEETTLDDETRQMLAWYVEGINAYIASRPGRLAAEFNLLRRQPAPWTVLDVIAHTKTIAWGLSVNWESELVRLQLSQQMDPVRAAELEPDYPTINPIITEGVGSQEAMRMVNTAGLLLNEYEKVKEWLGPQGAGRGSNSWVIAPERTINRRRAILCNDPHLPVTMPSIWYENHLHCPDFQASGASFAGIPAVIIGHNGQIAWGLTNALPDVQDLYIERPHPDDPTRFDYQGQWEQAQVFQEEIRVKGQSNPHVEKVIVTRHGPLISELVGEGTPVSLALRWTGHEPGAQIRAILKLNQARNWEEFSAALADWHTPAQNITYADSEGNIGYRMAGRVPIRDQGLGLVPAPGWRGDHEWSGAIPSGQLPHLYNPSSGVIVTANNKMAGDDYPYFLGLEYLPGWRARRIEQMLKQKNRLSLREMEQVQMDNTSLYAETLTPYLSLLDSDDPYERIALKTLRDWNYRMEPQSSAALIFHYTLLHLLQMTFGDKLGPAYSSFVGESISPLAAITSFTQRTKTRLLTLLEGHEESPWYADAQTGRPRSRDELLQEALSAAVRRIRREVNPTPRQWAWGRMHQVRFTHPLGSVRILGRSFNRGPYPVGGDSTTPNQTAYAPHLPPGLVQIVASYRQIVDVGNWDRTLSVITNGQSGHPLSRNYTDQIPMWLEGVYHAMPWSRAAVETITQQRLTLGPARAAAEKD